MNQDHTPGKGCLCHAHSEAECGCDVDWTPREVYELREECMEQARLLGMSSERELKLLAEIKSLEESRDFWRKAALNPHR